MQMSAASTLGNLSNKDCLHAMLISAGAVAPLVRLLQSADCPKLQDLAARALMGLTHLMDDAQVIAIGTAGGIPTLVGLLRPGLTDSEAPDSTNALALRVLTALAAGGAGSPEDFNAMKQAGALTLLIKLQGCTGVRIGVRDAAASLLQILQLSSNQLPLQAPPPPSTSAHSSASHHTSTPDPASGPAVGNPSTSLAAEGTRQSASKKTKLCWWCGVTGVPLKKCSVCAVAAYCGTDCQKADWKAHKGQCTELKAGAAASSSASGSGPSAAAGMMK